MILHVVADNSLAVERDILDIFEIANIQVNHLTYTKGRFPLDNFEIHIEVREIESNAKDLKYSVLDGTATRCTE